MPRLAPLDFDNLTPGQQRARDARRSSQSDAVLTPVWQRMAEVMANRDVVIGPVQAWLRSPSLLEALQPLNAHWWSADLPMDLKELVILLTGKHWRSQFEFWAHAQTAHEAGLPEDVIEAIRTGESPKLDRPDLRVACNVVTEHFASNCVSDATYRRAVDILGERGLVDLIGIVGFYGLVSMTLNVFELSVPPSETEPLA